METLSYELEADMEKVARFSVGIDLHETIIQVCVLDGDGAVVEEKRWRGASLAEGHHVVRWLTEWRVGGRFAVEAIGVNRWFVTACREVGLDVVVVDPIQLKLKALGKKTDRRDAREIARRLYLGDIDAYATTYCPTPAEYALRKLVRTQRDLLQMRQGIGLRIRSMLRAHRVPAPKGAYYRRKGLEWLSRCELPEPEETMCLQHWVALLGEVQAHWEAVMKRVKRLGTENAAIASLVAMLPSVQAQTAAVFWSELGNPGRFRRTRQVGSYAGLVPRVAESADRSHHGSLTKRGNRHLRWALGQWAVRLMARDPIAQAWATPRLRRMHRNKVRTALARKLLIGVYVSLRDDVPFSLETCLGQ